MFEGDNLDILRGLDTETIDLIYLDPPFNSKKTDEAPIGSGEVMGKFLIKALIFIIAITLVSFMLGILAAFIVPRLF